MIAVIVKAKLVWIPVAFASNYLATVVLICVGGGRVKHSFEKT